VSAGGRQRRDPPFFFRFRPKTPPRAQRHPPALTLPFSLQTHQVSTADATTNARLTALEAAVARLQQ
jgi:hypothetical protein